MIALSQKIKRGYAVLLLLLSILLPVFSVALAEDYDWLQIEITQETALLDAAAMQIGTLLPDTGNGLTLLLESGERIEGIQVNYLISSGGEENQTQELAGKTKVSLSIAQAAQTLLPEPTLEQAAIDLTPDPTSNESFGKLPPEGWIDTGVVLATLISQHRLDQEAIKDRDAMLAGMTPSPQDPDANPSETTPQPTQDPQPESDLWARYPWLAYVLVGFGMFAIGMLAWIAVTISAAHEVSSAQTRQLLKLAEHLSNGIVVKSPLKVEQTAWPRDGRVQITSETLDRIASISRQGGAVYTQPPQTQKEPEPTPVREGEEPDLLALANSLAGITSAAEWHARVQEAGFYARLLQANPTDKGSYIADEGGYSILACLMRSENAPLAYVVPSYQDPKASEPRWSSFFVVNEDNVVLNFRIDTLPVMFVEHGVFFLLKSKGRLTRRVQYY